MPSAIPAGSRVLGQGAAASWVEGYRTRAPSDEACGGARGLDDRYGQSGERRSSVPYPVSRSGVQVASTLIIVVALGVAAVIALWMISTLS